MNPLALILIIIVVASAAAIPAVITRSDQPDAPATDQPAAPPVPNSRSPPHPAAGSVPDGEHTPIQLRPVLSALECLHFFGQASQ